MAAMMLNRLIRTVVARIAAKAISRPMATPLSTLVGVTAKTIRMLLPPTDQPRKISAAITATPHPMPMPMAMATPGSADSSA